jgi:branched-chain amino acid transport system ATP-binding protein
MSDGALLEVRGLHFAYGTADVLFGVDLSVGAGECLALIGPNGAGKTTLLRVVAGLQRQHRGSVRIGGKSVDGLRAHERAALGMSTMFGGQAVFGELSVELNLRAVGELLGDRGSELDDRVAAMYELFPRLGERRTSLGAQLSGGEQQMLALAKALLPRPALLCIDELSLGLAPRVVRLLVDALAHERAAGTAMLLVDQSVRVALELGDRVGYVDRGRIVRTEETHVLDGRPDRLRRLLLEGAAV